MTIWKRVRQIFRSRRNSDADDIEHLQSRLDDSYRSQVELLQKVRRGAADVATSRKRVELQIAKIKQQCAELDDQAKAAVQNDDDDAARAALTRKKELSKASDRLVAQQTDLSEDESRLQDNVSSLQAKIEEFRMRKDTLSARQSAAAARAEVNSATSGVAAQMGDVGQTLDSAERRTRQMESHADAVDELVDAGVIDSVGADEHSTADFDRKFEELSGASDVDDELEALKSASGGTHGKNEV